MHLLSGKRRKGLSVQEQFEDDAGKRDISIKRLKYRHLPRADRTLADAFVGDPMLKYMRDTPDMKWPRLYDGLRRAIERTLLVSYVVHKTGLTVDRGAGIVVCVEAKNSPSKPNRPVDRLIDYVLKQFNGAMERITTLEQKRRRAEINSHVEVGLKKIGQRIDEMVKLDGLATEPASQGRGYGGALVDAVTAFADSQSRATLLYSSNDANTWFYNHHGFETVHAFEVGAANPTWDGKPVVIRVMVREPRTAGLHQAEKA
ncbi:hypothetical protein PLICRDRAFT_169647 [Plicaturopsis crispa FD-325 SS-3]|nr:hypothetical protein PLICRDRAFT_169647 [Plicaturopsis crispa FD-325 SS-3]